MSTWFLFTSFYWPSVSYRSRIPQFARRAARKRSYRSKWTPTWQWTRTGNFRSSVNRLVTFPLPWSTDKSVSVLLNLKCENGISTADHLLASSTLFVSIVSHGFILSETSVMLIVCSNFKRWVDVVITIIVTIIVVILIIVFPPGWTFWGETSPLSSWAVIVSVPQLRDLFRVVRQPLPLVPKNAHVRGFLLGGYLSPRLFLRWYLWVF